MPIHVNKDVVVLFFRCKQCGKLFQKEVTTYIDLENTMLPYAQSKIFHECSEGMRGIAEVQGAKFRLDYDPEV